MSTTTVPAPPVGTFASSVDSQGNAENVPTVTAASLTDAQAAAIAAWLTSVNPAESWTSLTTNLQNTIAGAAPGFNTNAEVLVNAYAQALQGNKLDTGAANSGLDIPNPLESIESFLSKLTSGNTWIRVGEFAVGFLMVGIAIAAIVKQSTGASPTGVLKKVTPVGRALTAASNSSNKVKVPSRTMPAPQYEGQHDRIVAKHSMDNPRVDLSAPIL